MMTALSAKRLLQVGLGDNGAGVEIDPAYRFWTKRLWPAIEKRAVVNTHISQDLKKEEKSADLNEKKDNIDTQNNQSNDKTKPRKKSNLPKTSDQFEDDLEDIIQERNEQEPLLDLEDLGKMKSKKKPQPKDSKQSAQKISPGKLEEQIESEEEDDEDFNSESEEEEEQTQPGKPKEMLTPSLRQALMKQGYKLLGSHSGVKMCRWTKAMLRGRGGCYKHTFYGISSYQCMEMTPSLACANVIKQKQEKKKKMHNQTI